MVVEILNATLYMDLDRVWVLAREKFMRDGDIYIGITSKPCTIPVMCKLDSTRYAPLSWKNPRTPTLCDQELGNIKGASTGATEDGLFWDVLIDLPTALRDENNSPLREYLPFYTYLSGWSQSGGYMIRFVNTFAYLDPSHIQKPLYDGYMSTGAAVSSNTGLNQEESVYCAAEDKRYLSKLGKLYQPFMEIHTEAENAARDMENPQREDSDADDFKYRAYDIPGASHGTKDNIIDYYCLDPDLPRTGIFPNYGGREPYPNDYPYNLSSTAHSTCCSTGCVTERSRSICRAFPSTPISEICATRRAMRWAAGARYSSSAPPPSITRQAPLKMDFKFGGGAFATNSLLLPRS